MSSLSIIPLHRFSAVQPIAHHQLAIISLPQALSICQFSPAIFSRHTYCSIRRAVNVAEKHALARPLPHIPEGATTGEASSAAWVE